MGVRGLQTFLKNNLSLAKRSVLHDTSLVIDANNLLCSIFCLCIGDRTSANWRNDIYGGDMVAYSEAIRNFFAALDKCNITPVLVFDGSVIGKQSTNELIRKDREVLRRCMEKFQNSQNFMEEAPNEMIMSQLIHHVFKVIICELKLTIIQAPYEADTLIAKSANDFRCPVLTNDSDFFIYPLEEGLIMFDLFHYMQPVPIKDKFGIACSIFNQNLLSPGIRVESLPLVAILLGNDFVDSSTFDRVIGPICDRYYSGLLKAETRSHRKIANLLDWLKNKSLDEAITFILDQIHQSNREKLRQTIKVLSRSYKIELADNLEAELNEIYPPSGAGESINNICLDQMPVSYLRRLFEKTDLSPIALDIVFHNTHYNYILIDDAQLPSSNYVKYRPFALLLTLLRPLSYKGLTTYRRKIQAEENTFYVYDRVKEDYKKLKILPMEELENYGSLEHLSCYSIITLEPALKKNILQMAFRFNENCSYLMTDTLSSIFSDSFVHEATICLLLVRYIGLETRVPPKAEFVDALVLTMFYYAALNGQLNKDLSTNCDYGRLLLILRPHSFKNNAKTYTKSQSLFRRIGHFISQLQAAYVGYSLLNALLDHVYLVPHYETFFNGTLIFRITKLLRLGELKLVDLCVKIERLFEAMSAIKAIVHCE